MQDADTCAMLDALVTLTSEREPLALDAHFCRFVAALLRPRAIRVIHARKRAEGWIWRNEARRSNDPSTHVLPPAPPITPAFLARFDAENLFSVQTCVRGRNLSVVPLMLSERLLRGLLVEHGEISPQLSQSVAHAICVYRNHLRLLADSQTDTLTGLLNRKTFDEKIAKLMLSRRALAPRESSGAGGACLAVLDIDHFKRINDRFGHLYGDEVLLLFSRLMRDTFREDDMLFRFGGEEFVVVLNVGIADAIHVLERFRRKSEQREFPQVGKVTASIGVVSIAKQNLTSTVVQQADEALYYAKQNGRNRVCCYEHLVASSALTAPQVESEVILF